MSRIPYIELQSTFESILKMKTFSPEKASVCATLFAKASLDGVASHGLNRFPAFLEMVEKGWVDPHALPSLEFALPVFERWNGHLGPGMFNAQHAMGRAIEMAKGNGMGCVALNNTNHWMRGGNFGWQAAEAGCVAICFTNTLPNMPAWGGSEPKVGNNPLVMAIPRGEDALVLDMAMTQFSYGKMSGFQKKDIEMPFDAGFDEQGNLTKNPAFILAKQLALPMGLWKGAGLSMMLDLMASLFSKGKATHEIGELETEYSISQFFLCLHPATCGLDREEMDVHIQAVLDDLKTSAVFNDNEVWYPGEQSLIRRKSNLENGVPVDPEIWEKVKSMLN
ncbi:MAG: 3-dehydro-L-gulonate 2-dehydrogenase [Cyclobacteriaceae bacterium]